MDERSARASLSKHLIRLQNNLALRYLLIGGGCATLDLVIYTLLISVFGAEIRAANVTSVLFGICFSFFLNARYNFRVSDKLPLRFGKFLLVGIAGLFLSDILIHLFIENLSMGPIAAKISTLFFVFLFQFSANRYFSFGGGGGAVGRAAAHHVLEARAAPRLLSLVVPLYNEEEVLPLLKRRLLELAEILSCQVEFVMVNDGSSDKTLELLLAWAAEEPRVKIIGLSRNFGHQIAATAGLDASRGDAVVLLDGDLQDPPEVIPKMVERYMVGYDVIFGLRVKRNGEGPFKRVTAWAFYRLMQKIAAIDMPLDSGDFRLMSRRYLDVFLGLREHHRFLRGMGAWVGFPQTAICFERPPRAAGDTKYTLTKMLRLAADAGLSFSAAPLRICMFLGAGSLVLGLLVGAFAFIQGLRWLMGFEMAPNYSPGWASLMTVTTILSGTLLFSLGVLGEYVGRLFEASKQRPLYVVSIKRNIEVS